MNINDFDIEIKKYDPEANVLHINVTVGETIEIRGFQARYTSTRASSNPVWVISPPSVKKGSHYFWVVMLLKPELWRELKEKITDAAENYRA